MINMIRRLTAKEWGMIALSTVFICLAVWMDLKTPEYLSDITTLLAQEGTKVSDIMDPGSKMLLFSFGSFLMAVLVGFLASRVAASYTTRLRGEIFHQVMDYSDAEIITKGSKFTAAALKNLDYEGIQSNGWTDDEHTNSLIRQLIMNFIRKYKQMDAELKRKKFSITIGDELPSAFY